MKNYSFHPDAVVEFNHSIEYYDNCAEALGLDFATEVHSSIERILAHPLAWTEIDHGIRRCLVSRFPFGVLYSIEADQIYILAIMNLHKDPDYWNYRL
jgi:toxin ParE1/3/4